MTNYIAKFSKIMSIAITITWTLFLVIYFTGEVNLFKIIKFSNVSSIFIQNAGRNNAKGNWFAFCTFIAPKTSVSVLKFTMLLQNYSNSVRCPPYNPHNVISNETHAFESCHRLILSPSKFEHTARLKGNFRKNFFTISMLFCCCFVPDRVLECRGKESTIAVT